MPPRAKGRNSAYLPNIRGKRWLLMARASADCTTYWGRSPPNQGGRCGASVGRRRRDEIARHRHVERHRGVGEGAGGGRAGQVAVAVRAALVVLGALRVGVAASVRAGRLVDVE